MDPRYPSRRSAAGPQNLENCSSSLRNAARPRKPIYEVIGIGWGAQKFWSRKNSSNFEGPRSIYIGEIWFLDPNRGWILPYIKRPRTFKNWRHFLRPNFLNFRSNPNHFTNLFPGSSCISEWARAIFPDFQGSGPVGPLPRSFCSDAVARLVWRRRNLPPVVTFYPGWFIYQTLYLKWSLGIRDHVEINYLAQN